VRASSEEPYDLFAVRSYIFLSYSALWPHGARKRPDYSGKWSFSLAEWIVAAAVGPAESGGVLAMPQKKGAAATAQADVARMDPGLGLTLRNLPETAQAADTKALRAQKLYQRTVAVEQLFLVVAAAGSLVTFVLGQSLGQALGNNDIIPYIVLGALAASVGVRLLRNIGHPDVEWYDSRALAEEIQSQSWRYTMGASPYQKQSDAAGGASSPVNSPEMRFVEECRRIRDSSKVHLPTSAVGAQGGQITRAMQQVREAALPERIAVYQRDRLEDQHRYYHNKARLYQWRARLWNLLILAVEAIALAASGAKLIGWSPFDLSSINLFGLAGTIVAGAAAWVQMKQFSALSRRYSAMARNLDGYLGVLRYTQIDRMTPDGWSELVNRVEQLLENEHEGWLNLYKSLHAQVQGGQVSMQDLEAQIKGPPHLRLP
jgi:hypothetical protein